MADSTNIKSISTKSITQGTGVKQNEDLGEITRKTIYEINEPYLFGGGSTARFYFTKRNIVIFYHTGRNF